MVIRRTAAHAVLGLALGLAVVTAASVALAAGPPVVALANRHFDHDRHAASSGAAGKTVPCAGCHDDKPRAEHARCAGCHQFPSSCSVMQTRGAAGPARVCRTCHVPTRAACLPTDLPPLPTRDSFTAAFTHAKHLSVGASIEQDCGVCHRAQVAAPPKQKPHVLCSGCHNPNGARPTMTECATCHVAPVGAAGKPTGAAQDDPFRIANFDHRQHTSASKLTSCVSCHDKAVGDAPKPSMLGCQTRCHDGQKAFSATGTRCTTCHKSAAPAPSARRDVGFSHAEHAKHSVKIDDCASCHVLEGDGTLAAPLARKDHQPCASAGCHQTEFVARAPKICGICHETTAPWTRTTARAVARTGGAGAEWFEIMNHASHLAANKAASCETCHGDKRTGAEPPRDHRACTGCHGRGQPPAMIDCKACHAAARPAALAVSPWNVAATFDHVRHAIDPRSRKPTACAECHTRVAAATDMTAVTPPRMADCDGCHDGKTGFKTTGFGCARCHGPKVSAGSTPAAASLRPAPVPLARGGTP